jgi:hypothetical protein
MAIASRQQSIQMAFDAVERIRQYVPGGTDFHSRGGQDLGVITYVLNLFKKELASEGRKHLAAVATQVPASRRNVASSRLPSTVMGELCERESNDFDR